MKRLFTVLAALVLALVPPACKKSEEGQQKSEEGRKPAARKPKIGISIPAADHGWAAGVGWWAKKKMAEYPDIEWVLATANEPGKQTADIEDMMAQKVDGLVVLATESAPVTPVAEKARQRGIFIVNVDRGFLKPVADIFLEGDNRAFGRKSAEFIVRKLGGKGNIVILRGIPSTVDTDRYEAAMEVFNKSPDIKVLAAQPGMWNQQKSLEVMQSYLSQFSRIDAVWASDDDMALGAEKAIKEAGRQNEMWIFGGGGMKDIVKRVLDKDPLYPADITYPPAMIAAGIDLAVANLRDGNEKAIADKVPAHLRLDRNLLQEKSSADKSQRVLKLDVHLITPDNAKEFYFPDSVY